LVEISTIKYFTIAAAAEKKKVTAIGEGRRRLR